MFIYKRIFTKQELSEVVFNFTFNLLCLGSSWSCFFFLPVIIWLRSALPLAIIFSFASSVHRSKYKKYVHTSNGVVWAWRRKGKGRTRHLFLEGILAIFHELLSVWGGSSWLTCHLFTDWEWAAIFLFKSYLLWTLVLPFSFLWLKSTLTEDYDVLFFLPCRTLSVCYVLNTSSTNYWFMELWLISIAENSRGELVQEIWATRVLPVPVRVSFLRLSWQLLTTIWAAKYCDRLMLLYWCKNCCLYFLVPVNIYLKHLFASFLS